jgi:hypothetical protein
MREGKRELTWQYLVGELVGSAKSEWWPATGGLDVAADSISGRWLGKSQVGGPHERRSGHPDAFPHGRVQHD